MDLRIADSIALFGVPCDGRKIDRKTLGCNHEITLEKRQVVMVSTSRRTSRLAEVSLNYRLRPLWRNGRRSRFKICWGVKSRVGSSPTSGTHFFLLPFFIQPVRVCDLPSWCVRRFLRPIHSSEHNRHRNDAFHQPLLRPVHGYRYRSQGTCR